VFIIGDSESASTNYYPGESEKVAEKELSDLPDDIKAMEQKDGCGEPGEPACDKSITDASGYGIDSDDDNTYTDTGKDGYGKKDKATSYHQPQVSSGKTERTDAVMYASGEFGDKCGTSPVYGKVNVAIYIYVSKNIHRVRSCACWGWFVFPHLFSSHLISSHLISTQLTV
jgi:hypothetical protein